MFYICCKQGNKLGVMDTTDNVLEFYTKEELSNFLSYNVTILGTEQMSKIVRYVWRFCFTSLYFTSSEFDFIIDYMQGNVSRDVITETFDETRSNYAIQIKSDYLKVKEFRFDILPSIMFSCSDLLIRGLVDLYKRSKRSEYDIQCFADTWKLDYSNLKRYYKVRE